MIDTEESRKKLAKELRRGDVSVIWMADYSERSIEGLRSDLERRVKRRVTVSVNREIVQSGKFITFNAGPKPARAES